MPSGATRARTLRMNRRLDAHSRATDERDMGNRPGLERVLGLDGPVWSLDGMEMRPEQVFRLLAHRWMTRAPCSTQAVTRKDGNG